MGRRLPQEEEIETWVRANARKLVVWAVAITGDRPLGEDIAGMTIEKVCKLWPDPEMRMKITSSSAYVRTMVKNTYLDYIKEPSRTNKHEVELVVGGIGEEFEDDPDINSVPARLLMSDAFGQLDIEQKRLVYYAYYLDLKLKDVGKAIGVDQKKVYTQNKKVLKKLRAILGDSEEED